MVGRADIDGDKDVLGVVVGLALMDGAALAVTLGAELGMKLAVAVGSALGDEECVALGGALAVMVGPFVEAWVGGFDGRGVGFRDGADVVGLVVGTEDGDAVVGGTVGT